MSSSPALTAPVRWDLGACSIRFRRQVGRWLTSPRRATATTPSCTAASTARPAGTFATGTTASLRAKRPSGKRPRSSSASRTATTGHRIASPLVDYLNDRWLPLKKSQLSRSTYESYRNNVRLHVAPRIGSIQLRQLQPEDLDTLLRRAARRREAQRRRRWARTKVGSQHPRHAPQGAGRCSSQGHRAP